MKVYMEDSAYQVVANAVAYVNAIETAQGDSCHPIPYIVLLTTIMRLKYSVSTQIQVSKNLILRREITLEKNYTYIYV